MPRESIKCERLQKALAGCRKDHFDAWRTASWERAGTTDDGRLHCVTIDRSAPSVPPLWFPLHPHLQHLNMSCAPFLAQKLFSVKGLVGTSSSSALRLFRAPHFQKLSKIAR